MATIEKRQAKNGKISYRVKIRIKGHYPEVRTFYILNEAKKWARSTEDLMKENMYFRSMGAKKYTLDDLIDCYMKEYLIRKPKSIYTQKSQLIWWKNEIGKYMLEHIKPALIVMCRNKLIGKINKFGRKIGIATSNRYCQVLSHVFTIAVKELGWVEKNPFLNISKLKEPRGRIRFLTDAEQHKLLHECKESSNPHLFAIVVLALSTGARKMELLSLIWKDVDFKRQVIILRETKNGEIRVVPLKGYALELIQDLSSKAHFDYNYVFPSKDQKQPIDIRTAWENALIRAEIKDFRFHDLRHTAASYLAMSGATLAEIAEVLGHKTLQMVKRYAHFSEAHTSLIVERMNNCKILFNK